MGRTSNWMQRSIVRGRGDSDWLYSSGDQFLKSVDVYAVKDSFFMVMNRPADWMNYLDSYLDSIGLSGN